MAQTRSTNGDVVAGMPLWFRMVLAGVAQVGAPYVLVAAVLYGVFAAGKPWIDSQVEVQKATVRTQERLADAVESLNDGIEEIIDVERDTAAFMSNVKLDHATADRKLDVIIDQTKPKPGS